MLLLLSIYHLLRKTQENFLGLAVGWLLFEQSQPMFAVAFGLTRSPYACWLHGSMSPLYVFILCSVHTVLLYIHGIDRSGREEQQHMYRRSLQELSGTDCVVHAFFCSYCYIASQLDMGGLSFRRDF